MPASLLKVSITGLVFLLRSHAAPLNERATKPPAITTDFPDPSIIQVDNTWYAFGSQSAFDHKDIKVQLASSSDFNTWTLSGQDVLATLPSWVDKSNPAVRGPDVIQRDDGQFVMYFSATTTTAGNGRFRCVGTALSNKVDGPYKSNSDTPFACPTDAGGAIDPSGFRDLDGARYLLYKIDGNTLGHGGSCGNTVPLIVSTPIMIQQVQADGLTHVDKSFEILTNDQDDGPLVESPAMLYHNGTYFLLFSSQCYTTTGYDVSYAWSTSPVGFFTKTTTPMLQTGPYGLIGPGGAGVAADGTHFAFHAYKSLEDVGQSRAMFTSTIPWK